MIEFLNPSFVVMRYANAATSAVIAATAIPTGLVIAVNTADIAFPMPPSSMIFPPSRPIAPDTEPNTETIFPITNRAGPATAAIPAIFSTSCCNSGSAAANAFTISVAFWIIGVTIGSKFWPSVMARFSTDA